MMRERGCGGWLVTVLVVVVAMLGGCKVQLYTNLTEDEANEMMGLLLNHGIVAEKSAGQEQTFSLMVDDSQIADALDLLREYGYPRPKFKSMGDVFKREGMVSSPMEERVRFIYALSQELAETVSKIDGVITARVHIVLPENNPLSEKSLPSSASVFVKHRSDVDLAAVVPRIKALVANSIEGLTYDRVAVVLVEIPVTKSVEQQGGREVSRRAPSSSGAKIALLGGGALALGVGIGGVLAYVVLSKRSIPRNGEPPSRG